MKTPTDPKEELLQQLAKSLLRDVFAAAASICIGRDYVEPGQIADKSFERANLMLAYSHTPALIEQLSKLKS